jgi:taurine dioxygenase
MGADALGSSVTDVTQAMRGSVRRLGGTLGAELVDIDLRALDDNAFAVVHAALVEHAVLVVRDQSLDPGAQAAFTSRFGELYMHGGPIEGHPELLLIANMLKARIHADDDRVRKVTEVWHADYTFWEVPPALLVLAAQELPDHGGDTLFADQRAAYDALSDGMKRLLDGLDAVHEPPAYRDRDPGGAVHPVVVAHPESGRAALLLNTQSVRAFDGMTVSESEGLLAFLFAHSTRPEFVYRHRWLPGDVVIWDNRATIHYAVDDYGDAPRVLHRTSVVGTRPARAATSLRS